MLATRGRLGIGKNFLPQATLKDCRRNEQLLPTLLQVHLSARTMCNSFLNLCYHTTEMKIAFHKLTLFSLFINASAVMKMTFSQCSQQGLFWLITSQSISLLIRTKTINQRSKYILPFCSQYWVKWSPSVTYQQEVLFTKLTV